MAPVRRHARVDLVVNTCSYQMEAVIDNLRFTRSLFTYTWGKICNLECMSFRLIGCYNNCFRFLIFLFYMYRNEWRNWSTWSFEIRVCDIFFSDYSTLWRKWVGGWGMNVMENWSPAVSWQQDLVVNLEFQSVDTWCNFSFPCMNPLLH